MDIWIWFIIALPIIAIVGGVLSTAMKSSSFVDMGDIQGKPLAEIIAAVGQPNSVSGHSDGALYQWIGVNGGSSYHYVILVDIEQRAVGYTHQHVG